VLEIKESTISARSRPTPAEIAHQLRAQQSQFFVFDRASSEAEQSTDVGALNQYIAQQLAQQRQRRMYAMQDPEHEVMVEGGTVQISLQPGEYDTRRGAFVRAVQYVGVERASEDELVPGQMIVAINGHNTACLPCDEVTNLVASCLLKPKSVFRVLSPVHINSVVQLPCFYQRNADESGLSGPRSRPDDVQFPPQVVLWQRDFGLHIMLPEKNVTICYWPWSSVLQARLVLAMPGDRASADTLVFDVQGHNPYTFEVDVRRSGKEVFVAQLQSKIELARQKRQTQRTVTPKNRWRKSMPKISSVKAFEDNAETVAARAQACITIQVPRRLGPGTLFVAQTSMGGASFISVAQVAPDAERFGMRAGQILTEVNGQCVSSVDDVEQLLRVGLLPLRVLVLKS
jgi:hypothetical protein